MLNKKLISFLLLFTLIFGSGGFDTGTSTGKGKFKIDLTWNPFNKIVFGQTYAVMSYGLSDRFDIHGYLSKHHDPFYTYYAGIFYQFYNSDKLDLATAIGARKRSDKTWTHFFTPQILYTINIAQNIFIGGSFVDVRDSNKKSKIGMAIDLSLFYNIGIETKHIESVSIGMGGFHPAEKSNGAFFLPTYSIDIKFK